MRYIKKLIKYILILEQIPDVKMQKNHIPPKYLKKQAKMLKRVLKTGKNRMFLKKNYIYLHFRKREKVQSCGDNVF